MSLSIKDTTPSAWDSFVATHKTGDVVRGKVSRFAGFGVFVELGNGLEGLCHISELADERVEKPEDVVSLGQEVDFKILRIEHDDQKIGLSHRAVGKNEEPIVDTKNYSTEAKGGMASLGELMNLKRGSATEDEVSEEPKLSKKERKAIKAKERAEQEADAEEDSESSDAVDSDDTETVQETSASENSEVNSEVEQSAKSDNTAEEESAVDEKNDSADAETGENASETPAAEAGEPEFSETNVTTEAETTAEEKPLLDDLEGEASVAPEDSTPRETKLEETTDNAESVSADTEENTETGKPEAEEKSA